MTTVFEGSPKFGGISGDHARVTAIEDRVLIRAIDPAEVLAKVGEAETTAGPWALDTSTGSEILVKGGCSVIEGEDARYLLRLIAADTSTPAPDTTRAIAQMNDTRTGPSVTCPASRHAAMISEALMSGAPYAMLAEAPEHCGASIADTVAALWEARAEVEQLRTAQRAAFIEGFMTTSEGCNGEYARDGDPQDAAEAAADGWIADLVWKEGRR